MIGPLRIAISTSRLQRHILRTCTVALIWLGLTPLICHRAKAQEVTIRGEVWTDEHTRPPKATIVVCTGKGKKICKTCDVTTETGKYELPVALTAGTYMLRAYDNYNRWQEDRKVCVFGKASGRAECVLKKGPNDNIDFTLRTPKARVDFSGTIKDATGVVIKSAEITYALLGCSECIVGRFTTNEEGKYSAEDFAVGNYLRVVAFEGVLSEPQVVEVTPERTYQASLTIEKRGSRLEVFEPAPYRESFPRQEIATVGPGRSITGTFTDQNGAIVPRVTVTVTLQGGRSQTSISDEEGKFAFFNLDPGTYTVEGTASNFAKFTGDVQITLASASVVNGTMVPAGVSAEAVVVSGGSGTQIDTTTAGSNVTSEQFSNFPTQRTIQGLYAIAPTAVRSGRDRDPSVSGSSGLENNYIVDGVTSSEAGLVGSGSNLPVEFVQEIDIKTGAYGAEFGTSTGGIFNVVTRSGSNYFHGDLFGYGTTKGFVRRVKNFPFTGSALTDYSQLDIGGDVGGPVVKDKLWYFVGFNPQVTTNFYLTQGFHAPRQNKVKTPYYAGKLIWAINSNNALTFSTFGDFTSLRGFLGTGTLTNASGFGSDPKAFEGRQEVGGHGYGFRLNSTINPNFVAELSGGLRFQKTNTLPVSTTEPLVSDNFAVIRNGAVLPVIQTGVNFGGETGFIDFVDGRGGFLQRNFLRGPGFGLVSLRHADNYEVSARLQAVRGKHTIKWGVEWFGEVHNLDIRSTGPNVTYANPLGLPFRNGPDANQVHGAMISNNFLVCAARGSVINCPNEAALRRVQVIPISTLAALGLTVNNTVNPITLAEALSNPFLIRGTTRVRGFEQAGTVRNNVESFYIQDDYRFMDNWQANIGVRWDFQQSSADGLRRISLNNFWDNLAPRLGLVWDFTGRGKGKLFANYSTFIATPIRVNLTIRASGGELQSDKNFNVDQYSAPPTSTIVPGVSTGAANLGHHPTTIDRDLKPQAVIDGTAGVEYEVVPNLAIGARGIYRRLKNVIEDGSFDDGETFFIFNPGRNEPGTSERSACEGDMRMGAPRCFGPARRYYRALELTATKRFTNNYQFIASYVFLSLIGNYDGQLRNDNPHYDSNVISLFDYPALLTNTYGRLPNDRPHQFKFNGSYRTPWNVSISGNLYIQSGMPFNQMLPHPTYGNNEGLGVPRGAAVVPPVAANDPGFPNIVHGIDGHRAPMTANFDLGFSYTIKVGEESNVRISADWFNVLNRQRALSLDSTYSVTSGVTTVPPVLSPFWGSATLVQTPSALRLGVKFTF